MSQVKVFCIQQVLDLHRDELSRVIHSCVMDVLGLPVGKKAHRFFAMSPENYFMPDGRSEKYTIIEISMISGRTRETKKALIRALFDRISNEVGITQQDLEICISESPAENWGFRGLHGDEAQLPYRVEI
jgi:5-carboxymethyl-2-hydroxymuconate isomerase